MTTPTTETAEQFIEAQMARHFPAVERGLRGTAAGWSEQRLADAIALVERNLRAHWRRQFELRLQWKGIGR